MKMVASTSLPIKLALLSVLAWTFPFSTGASIRGRSLKELVLHDKKDKNNDLGECEGPCKRDKDCTPGLICFKRDANEIVPGCMGNDDSKAGYCILSDISMSPTMQPSTLPSHVPTRSPSSEPSFSSNMPSTMPTRSPSSEPSFSSNMPSTMPTGAPTSRPSDYDSSTPSSNPSHGPTENNFSAPPSELPSKQPTSIPSAAPSQLPSSEPTNFPSYQPSFSPSAGPTERNISTAPSESPTQPPTFVPSASPSQRPSPASTNLPSSDPTFSSNAPSRDHTHEPSQRPSNYSSSMPSSRPSARPTESKVSAAPSNIPSSPPTTIYSTAPSQLPSDTKSEMLPMGTDSPSTVPSITPSVKPSYSTTPSLTPSQRPSPSPTPINRQTYGYPGGRPPIDAIPLDLCQGDCKDHSECGPGLYCFQRGPNEEIPGCIGGRGDNSRTDYCTDIPPPWPAPTQSPTTAPIYTSQSPTVTPDTVPSAIPSSNPTPTPGHIFAWPGGPPADAYPLSQCQGDCLWHEDCADGMFCFQRDAYEAVPGCMGGETDGTNTDYCTYIAPVVAPVEPPTANNFRIKMYWDDYYWQEEDFDRVWCMQCKNGCQQGEVMFLHYCAWDSARFDFVNSSADQVQIQVLDTDLCLERSGTATSLEICDSSETLQHWKATQGSFEGDFFELSQNFDGNDYCVTTHHHPKYGEIIELFTCAIARRDDTSYWTKY